MDAQEEQPSKSSGYVQAEVPPREGNKGWGVVSRYEREREGISIRTRTRPRIVYFHQVVFFFFLLHYQLLYL